MIFSILHHYNLKVTIFQCYNLLVSIFHHHNLILSIFQCYNLLLSIFHHHTLIPSMFVFNDLLLDEFPWWLYYFGLVGGLMTTALHSRQKETCP